MDRRTARRMHSITSFSFWVDNPDWHTGNPAADTLLRVYRALPIDTYGTLLRTFYNTDKVLAVNGESVVAVNGPDQVDKFMFRYPGKMALEAFRSEVNKEIDAILMCLDGVALQTQVSVKKAEIFRNPRAHLEAVAQTQPRLDLDIDAALNLDELMQEPPSQMLDRTARDMESLLGGTERLIDEFGYLPDIADNSGNLRRSGLDGSVTLIDVMPFYTNGRRLIGDYPPQAVPHIQKNIQQYQNFVGQFGS